MKIPNLAKIMWWLLLTSFFAYLFIQRYNFIMSGNTVATDIIILLMLIALLVIPIFQEVNIFGVGFKKESENPRPSPEPELRKIIKISETEVKKHLEAPADRPMPIPETPIPSDVSRLFAIRYNLENELNRLTGLAYQSKNRNFYPRTVTQKLDLLVRINLIDPNLARILKEIYAQSSAAVHGEPISEQATQWIMQGAASTVQILRGIPAEPAQATKVQR